MAHVDFMAAVAGQPSSYVFDLEKPARLDARQRAVSAFARKLTLTPAQMGPQDVRSLQAHLTDAQVVQLVFAICHFNTMNRLADAFGVPLETKNIFAPLPKAASAEPAAGASPEASPKQAPEPAAAPGAGSPAGEKVP